MSWKEKSDDCVYIFLKADYHYVLYRYDIPALFICTNRSLGRPRTYTPIGPESPLAPILRSQSPAEKKKERKIWGVGGGELMTRLVL